MNTEEKAFRRKANSETVTVREHKAGTTIDVTLGPGEGCGFPAGMAGSPWCGMKLHDGTKIWCWACDPERAT